MNIESMSSEELFHELARTRGQIVKAAEHFNQVCTLMYANARRQPSDLTSTYVTIANSGKRFAGAVMQGAKRSEAIDRILSTTKKSIEEAKERETRNAADAERRRAKADSRTQSYTGSYGIFDSSNGNAVVDGILSQGSLVSDLDDLYGSES